MQYVQVKINIPAQGYDLWSRAENCGVICICDKLDVDWRGGHPCHVQVEEQRGEDSPLWHTLPHLPESGSGTSEFDKSLSPSEIAHKKAGDLGVEGQSSYVLDEDLVVHRVKSF